MLRYSLLHLLGLVLLVALGTAALLYANEVLVAVTVTATTLLLLASILLAIYGRGATRAFWLGAAIFGWAYFLLAFRPLGDNSLTNNLATTRSLPWLLEKVQRPADNPPADPAVQRAVAWMKVNPADPRTPTIDAYGAARGLILVSGSSKPANEHFVPIGQCLWALLLSFVGGMIACAVRSRMRNSTDSTAALPKES